MRITSHAIERYRQRIMPYLRISHGATDEEIEKVLFEMMDGGVYMGKSHGNGARYRIGVHDYFDVIIRQGTVVTVFNPVFVENYRKSA